MWLSTCSNVFLSLLQSRHFNSFIVRGKEEEEEEEKGGEEGVVVAALQSVGILVVTQVSPRILKARKCPQCPATPIKRLVRLSSGDFQGPLLSLEEPIFTHAVVI